MKAGIAIILTLALGALAANFVLQDNGYVLINFRGYVIEMSVPILIFLLVLGYLAVRLVIRTWHVPKQLGEMAARRRVRKSGELITRGYIELGQGNFAKGEKLLTKGVRNSETPLLNYLAAARAAHAQGDQERRDNWLNMAAEQEPRAKNAVLLTRAELQLESGEREAAQDTLTEILESAPRNAEALRLQAELLVEAADWPAFAELLPALRKHANLPAAQLDKWIVQAWPVLLADAGDDMARGNALWKKLPKHLRSYPAVVEARVRSLARQDKGKQAESVLRNALTEDWDAGLVLLYGELELVKPKTQLQRAEDWLRDRPEDPNLLHAAARLCVRNELWGKARSYYESSVAIQPSPRTWHELGQLMLKTGEEAAAYDAFQKGLSQSYGASDLPKLTSRTMSDD